jgi:hypothetical protein
MRKDFGRGKSSKIAAKRGDLCETKAAMRYAPSIVERLIFLQRITKLRLRFDRVFPGQSQCFNIGGVCLANAPANPDIDIQRRLQMALRTIEIIAPKRHFAEALKRIRLARPRANPDIDSSRRLLLGRRSIQIIASKRHIAEGVKRMRLAITRAKLDRDIPRRVLLGNIRRTEP